MDIASGIFPVFGVILLGWVARGRGFMPDAFLGPANRLVYYLAIPAMIFQAIARGPLKERFDPPVLAAALVSVAGGCLLSLAAGMALRVPRPRMGTYMQSSFHGNLGYIGLAVAFYAMGQEGFARAGILAGFIMILQNLLAVLALQGFGGRNRGGAALLVLRVAANPVIFSAFAGILASLAGLRLPVVLSRMLDIVAGLALPLALLLIGASLSFDSFRNRAAAVVSVTLLKLVAVPGLGMLCFFFLGIPVQRYLPGLILLASPTATITYVMAREMDGDADFAVAAVSASTVASMVSFSLWLRLM